MEVALVLDNIRSIHNVGSIFRTADAAGVFKIYLCGITPTPLDRFGDPMPRFIKVSLGAEKNVPWEYGPSTEQILEKLKQQEFETVAIEQSETSFLYTKFSPRKNKIALVVGNETKGIQNTTLSLCDKVIEIPMRGVLSQGKKHPRNTGAGKESLNVSVALGIVLFHLLSR